MKIQILKQLSYLKKDYKKGETIEIKDDGKGVPLDSFWRNRIKDSKIDNCVQIIEDKPTKKKEDK